MKISKNGIDLIKRFEGFRAHQYHCPAGFLTIGYGHVILKGEYFPDGITEEDACVLLDKDCDKAEAAINKVKQPLTQNEFDALVSFVFNVGTGAFKISTMKKKLEAGHLHDVANEFDKWVYVKGEIYTGLVTRRAAEKALFIS